MSSRLMRKSVEGRSLLLALGLVCLFVFAAADVSDSAEEPLPDYSILKRGALAGVENP